MLDLTFVMDQIKSIFTTLKTSKILLITVALICNIEVKSNRCLKMFEGYLSSFRCFAL